MYTSEYVRYVQNSTMDGVYAAQKQYFLFVENVYGKGTARGIKQTITTRDGVESNTFLF